MSLDDWDATDIAYGVLAGRVVPAQVAEHFLQCVQRHEKQVQAFASFDPDAVRRQALQAIKGDGLLAGVPVGIVVLASKGHEVHEVSLPDAFAGVFDDHQLINDCEGARSLAKEFQSHPELLSASTRAMVDRASVTTWEQESAAKQRLAELAPILASIGQPFDAMLSVSCGLLAPQGLETTGPSDFIKFWGAFGLPQSEHSREPGAGRTAGGAAGDRHVSWRCSAFGRGGGGGCSVAWLICPGRSLFDSLSLQIFTGLRRAGARHNLAFSSAPGQCAGRAPAQLDAMKACARKYINMQQRYKQSIENS